MPVKVIVLISGGKDSQACLKLALSAYHSYEVRGLFLDTQFEHPTTYEHIENMRHVYQVNIDVVHTEGLLPLVDRKGKFPSVLTRFCTDTLKIRPTHQYLKNLALTQEHGFEVWYGMRSAESVARKLRYEGVVSGETYLPSEFFDAPKYLDKLGVVYRLPIVDWGTEEVFEYIGDFKNPLYEHGFNRVGCFPCLLNTEKGYNKHFNYDKFGEEQRIALDNMSAKIGKTYISGKTSVCSYCEV